MNIDWISLSFSWVGNQCHFAFKAISRAGRFLACDCRLSGVIFIQLIRGPWQLRMCVCVWTIVRHSNEFENTERNCVSVNTSSFGNWNRSTLKKWVQIEKCESIEWNERYHEPVWWFLCTHTHTHSAVVSRESHKWETHYTKWQATKTASNALSLRRFLMHALALLSRWFSVVVVFSVLVSGWEHSNCVCVWVCALIACILSLFVSY